ncbi:MAG: 50S ribosomal protein L6 [Mycoplasma sp.]|nr:50S ribosomal protein L6 [Mycoplasma sp.]
MSRIGRRKIEILQDVKISLNNSHLSVEGPLGKLENTFSSLIEIKQEDNFLLTIRKNEEKATKQLHGTTNAIINNMICGVKNGFTKEIVIKGVGYRANASGNKVTISAGFSHPVEVPIIEGVKVTNVSPTELKVEGIDKVKVGQQAANLIAIKKPSIYSGKGIMYKNQKLILKEGKKSSK